MSFKRPKRAYFPDIVLLFQNLSMSEVLHFPGVVRLFMEAFLHIPREMKGKLLHITSYFFFFYFHTLYLICLLYTSDAADE